MIKRYFLEYRGVGSDMSRGHRDRRRSATTSATSRTGSVTLVDTGDESMTGGRVKQVGRPRRGLGHLPLHVRRRPGRRRHRPAGRVPPLARRLATVTGVHPPSPLRRAGARRRPGAALRREARRPRRPHLRRLLRLRPARARPPLRRPRVRPRARAAGGPGARRRAARLRATTASGSAPTRCATSSCCAPCGTAAGAPWKVWDDRQATAQALSLAAGGMRGLRRLRRRRAPHGAGGGPGRRHLPHRQLALDGRHARPCSTPRVRGARRSLPALQGPRRLRASTPCWSRPACSTATRGPGRLLPRRRHAGRPSERGYPGVEITGGSLGHGPSIAIGLALADRHDGSGRRTFCLVGDGELNEGSVWEALALAGHLRLDQPHA